MGVVVVKNLNKSYHLNKNTLSVLKNVNFNVEKGDFLAIAGPSGSGKTTLLNTIGCIDHATSGEVFIEGQEISTLTNDELADLRAQKISFIFQNFNLFPVLTALENVEYPLFFKSISSEEKKKRAEAALDAVGLLRFAKHKPLELSGGQQQRVAIARAIVGEPLLVLADEPTANLDHKIGSEILDLMEKINREKKVTFIFSTHDQKVMDRANRIIRIFDGEITE